MAFDAVAGLLAVSFLFSSLSPASAQDGVLVPGDAVVTGFSGFVPTGAAPVADPLDSFFINTEGPSAQILSFGALGGPPQGQLVTPATKKAIKAKDIGQVFAVGLDDGLGTETPNIYLGATSAFGIHIVRPDPADPTKFIRLKKGHAEAQWMKGMFGGGGNGNAGSIFKVDGATGTVGLFATLPGNSGPGVGDVVFDKTSMHFYASDLDTGMIHRIDSSGVLVDSFDHGVTGRPTKGLAPVADDGNVMDITNAAFDTEDPATWGYTQNDRMVYGMAVHNGRLYYAVAGGHQVWSIGLNDDGSFAGDAGWELDVTDLPGDGPITDMLFDKQGRMYLAQRGAQKGSYSYTAFAEDGKSAVVRYRLESPDDPATESIWLAEQEEYAIGMPAEHRRTNGGIALGYKHTAIGSPDLKTCGNMLWSTGDRLRTNAPGIGFGEVAVEPPPPAAEPDVHGIQGNDIALVRPQNVPPTQTYFADYDGTFGDPTAIGHIGDIEIWQPCQTDYAGYEPIPGGDFGFPPGYGILPPDTIPPDLPPEFPPPVVEFSANLKIEKWAPVLECPSLGFGYLCPFKVRVTNEGPDNYFNDLLLEDVFAPLPAGSLTGYNGAGGWICWKPGAGVEQQNCWRPATFLAPGASIDLTLGALIPLNPGICSITNDVKISWAPGGTQWNTDPTDDDDSASIKVPDPACESEQNLNITKTFKECLQQDSGDWMCKWDVAIDNLGPGVFAGSLTVDDWLSMEPTSISANLPWLCGPLGAAFSCTHPGVVIPVGVPETLELETTIAAETISGTDCKVFNDVVLASPLAPSPDNTDPLDDTSWADGEIPDPQLCISPLAAVEKDCPPGYAFAGDECVKGDSGDKGPSGKRPPRVTPVLCPDNMRKVRRQQVVSLRKRNWRLVRLSNGQWCGRPRPVDPPKEVCPHDMNEIATRTVRRRRRDGWTVIRLPSGQWCGQPVIVECPRHLRPIPTSRVSFYRQQNWTVQQLRNGKWCGKPNPIVDPCPEGMRPIKTGQVPRYRKLSWTLRRLKNGQWCGKPGPIVDPNLPCPEGMRPIKTGQVPRYRKLKWTLQRLKNGRWCGKPGVTPPPTQPPVCIGGQLTKRGKGYYCLCGPDSVRKPVGNNGGARCEPLGGGNRPQCASTEKPTRSARDARRARSRGYRVRKIATRLWCISGQPNPGPCPTGSKRVGKRCVPDIKPCPKDTRRVGKRCVPIVKPCPKDTRRVGKRCVPIVKPCPKDTRRVGRRCVPIVKPCPKDTRRVGRRCVPIVKPCPKNTRRVGKRCVPIVKPCPDNMYRAQNGRCVILR
ncbi:MAG: hypothetical protein ACR2PA_01345 [Hyphomicrobiaceae bacterium]